MRAEIDESGLLRIIAETPLEAFALRTWWEDFTAPNGTPKRYAIGAHYENAEKKPRAEDNA